MIVPTDESDDRVATFVYATVQPVPNATLELSVPVNVSVLLTVAVFQAPSVRVQVPVDIVLPLTVVATRAHTVCVPVNVFAASVRAAVKLASGNVIVLAAVGQEKVNN